MDKEEKIKEKNKKWFDEWADSYDWFFLKRLLNYWQDKAIGELTGREKRILEVSYGTGSTLGKIAKKFKKAAIYGIDISPNMKKEAEKKLRKFRKVKLFVSDVGKMLFKDNYFDFVFSTESFHHYPNGEKAIKEMARVLKKEGKLVIVDINLKPIWLFNFLFKLEPGFVHLYSQKEMRELFERYGIKMIKQERCGIFAVKNSGIKFT